MSILVVFTKLPLKIYLLRWTVQESRKESIKFDIVHFIHSTYSFDMEQTLKHCFENELSDNGHFVCLVTACDLIYWVLLKQRKQWHGEDMASESFETAEKLAQIANENDWRHEVYTQEYSIDVTEVFDPKSAPRFLNPHCEFS